MSQCSLTVMYKFNCVLLQTRVAFLFCESMNSAEMSNEFNIKVFMFGVQAVCNLCSFNSSMALALIKFKKVRHHDSSVLRPEPLS